MISVRFLRTALEKLKHISYHETLASVLCVVAASITAVCKIAETLNAADTKKMMHVVEVAFSDMTQIVHDWLSHHLSGKLLSTIGQRVETDEIQVRIMCKLVCVCVRACVRVCE